MDSISGVCRMWLVDYHEPADDAPPSYLAVANHPPYGIIPMLFVILFTD